MKQIESTLDAHMDGTTTSMTTCWKLKRTDDVIIAAKEKGQVSLRAQDVLNCIPKATKS